MARNLSPEQIPQGWKYELLDKVAERCSGHTPSKSIPGYWNGGIKWISLADTYRLDNGYIYDTDKKISHEGIQNSSAQLHPAETVVLSRDAGIGKSGVMAEPMAVSQHFIAWKCDNQEKMNSWFLYNWLQFHKSEFERQAVGSTIKTIGLPFFKKLKVVVPPYNEQRKIAKILSTWDKAISTTERLIDNSKQQKKALMQQLLTGKKRLLDDSGKPFEGEWEEVRLGDIARIYQPKTISQSKLTSTGYPVYGANGIIGKYSDFNHDTEQVAVTCRGSTCGVVNWTLPKSWITGNAMVVNLDANKECIKKFIYYLLSSSNLQYLITGSGQPQITGEIKNHKISLPNKGEQEKIAAVLINADKEIELLEHQLADLKQEKKALMQQLLTGKRRVKVDNEAVA
ncbi:restriction endonuclease subunit S (plasmid) [Alteromonas mediterranea]|uniref:Restriction endonuclease subunit S n=1 Tax=Alteromonas mediterranea TaxID=314275 RepID=A0AAC9JHK7_9ALTE|nr:restriction endonuclease subunit S [Alteromonas mediterranea]APD92212.1 restriction endonuclease subunit S [Alteromonas mediterranea]APE00067.1 restriction endonuclease subunit S [Alteromonas mediterranea]